MVNGALSPCLPQSPHSQYKHITKGKEPMQTMNRTAETYGGISTPDVNHVHIADCSLSRLKSCESLPQKLLNTDQLTYQLYGDSYIAPLNFLFGCMKSSPV